MISDQYQKVLRSIHESTSFGKRAKFPKHLENFIQKINPTSMIDFGCGKGRLVEKIKETYPSINIRGYDPGNKNFSNSINEPVDLLMSTDVLEHIEPVFLDETLQFLSTKSRYIYHLIACCPAKLILPDGRNAHLIIEGRDWWRKKFLDLNYKIINEEWLEFTKFSKELQKPLLIKKYIIMAEKQDGISHT
jgi:hypothetical protein